MEGLEATFKIELETLFARGGVELFPVCLFRLMANASCMMILT